MNAITFIDRMAETPYTAKQVSALFRFASANMSSAELGEIMGLEFREAQNRVKMLVDKALLEPVSKGQPNTGYRLTKSGKQVIFKLLKP
jgi:predicted transcriptional regulator